MTIFSAAFPLKNRSGKRNKHGALVYTKRFCRARQRRCQCCWRRVTENIRGSEISDVARQVKHAQRKFSPTNAVQTGLQEASFSELLLPQAHHNMSAAVVSVSSSAWASRFRQVRSLVPEREKQLKCSKHVFSSESACFSVDGSTVVFLILLAGSNNQKVRLKGFQASVVYILIDWQCKTAQAFIKRATMIACAAKTDGRVRRECNGKGIADRSSGEICKADDVRNEVRSCRQQRWRISTLIRKIQMTLT